jgi:hypothetical protein
MRTHYGFFTDSVTAIEGYDIEFRSRLAGSGDTSPLYLYIDELPSLLSSLSKSGRSEMDSNIYQYMAMNRSLGLSTTLAAQRLDSAWFAPGTRENVLSRIGLSTLGTESAKMLFSSTENIEPQGTGRGYYQAGAKLERIIVPYLPAKAMNKIRLCIWRLVTW